MTAGDRHRDYEELRDDLAAYALGALPEAEAEGLGAHLEGCARCRELLHWLTPAVDVLPAAVAQLEPPGSLRERLMAVVMEEAADAQAAREPASRPGDTEAMLREPWWRRLPPHVVLRPATALAATAVLAVGLVGGYAMRGGGDPADQPATFVEARALSGNPDVSATLEREGDSATLHVNELPELPPTEVYEVWIERGDVMEPSTLFVLDRNGSAVAAVPGPLEGADRVLVTAEPRGGSQSPTSPPLLAAPVS